MMPKKVQLYGLYLLIPLFFVACSQGGPLENGAEEPPEQNNACLTEDDIDKDRGVVYTCASATEEEPLKDQAFYLVRENVVVTDVQWQDDPKDRIIRTECSTSSYPQWKGVYKTVCEHCCRPDQVGSELCGSDRPPGFTGTCASGYYKGCLDKDFVFLWRAENDGSTPQDGDTFDVAIKTTSSIPWCMDCDNPDGTWKKVWRRFPGYSFAMGEFAASGLESEADDSITYSGKEYLLWGAGTGSVRTEADGRNHLGEYPMVKSSKTFQMYEHLIKTSVDDSKILYLTETLVEDGTSIQFLDYREADVTNPGRSDPTLQLKGWTPSEPAPEQGWWNTFIPECKPLIYLYPEAETTLTVRPKPRGLVTETDPEINTYKGWEDVTAYPDGRIMHEGVAYDSLYYESLIGRVFIPKEGFVVKKENLENFFETVVPKLGLNDKEGSEFKEYWLSRLTTSPYYFIRFLTPEEIEAIEPLEVSVKPDTIIRLRAYFKPLAKPIVVEEQGLAPPPKRDGFTLVEWGGLYDDPSEPLYATLYELTKSVIDQFADWLTK